MKAIKLDPAAVVGMVAATVLAVALSAARAIDDDSFVHHMISKGGLTQFYGGKVLANFDDDPDLEFSIGSGSGVKIFDLQGDGSWQRHDIAGGSNWEIGADAADLDGDGDNDLMIGVYWYQNNGSFSFSPHRFDNGRSQVHDGVFADIDNDDKLEAVLLSDAEGFLTWYDIPDDPTQGWTRHDIQGGVNVSNAGDDVHGAFQPKGIGDLDGDGDNDIVLPFCWLENKDDGSSWSRHDWGVDIGKKMFYGHATRSWIEDFNGDDENDVVLAECDGSGGRCALLLNGGNGSSWEKIEIISNRGSLHNAGVADFDNDGDLDIFTADQEDTYQCFPPDGHPKAYVFENLGDNRDWEPHVVCEDLGFQETQVGDVDNDGDMDIMSHNWTNWSGNAAGGQDHTDLIENTMGPFPVAVGKRGSGFGVQGSGSVNRRVYSIGSTTAISFGMGEAGTDARVRVHSLDGRFVEEISARDGALQWDVSRGVRAGIYTYRLSAGNDTEVHGVLILTQ